MAVTYAWRLDANKYAYIIDPDTGENGYISLTPVVGDKLNTIAATANERFGEKDGDTPEVIQEKFANYKKALKAMRDKFPEGWKFYDFLSADVYYNVDSSNCADLKGVGIKGVRFLGTADPNTFDIENPVWKENGKVSEPGVFLVYGIYMEDQTTDDIINKTKTPENIFVVRNGDNGNSDGSASTAILEEKLDNEKNERINADNELSDEIAILSQKISNINPTPDNEIDDLKEKVKEMEEKIDLLMPLISKVKELEEWVNSQSTGGTGSLPGSTGSNFDGSEANDTDTYYMIVTDGDNNLYKAKKVRYEEAVLKSTDGFFNE